MKPGICVLCGKPWIDEVVPNEGSYVKFSDYEEPEIFSLDDPTGMEYFCDEHVKAAEALSTFTSKDALAALKKQFGVIPETGYALRSSGKKIFSRCDRICHSLGVCWPPILTSMLHKKDEENLTNC